jgi:hypothetical protein
MHLLHAVKEKGSTEDSMTGSKDSPAQVPTSATAAPDELHRMMQSVAQVSSGRAGRAQQGSLAGVHGMQLVQLKQHWATASARLLKPGAYCVKAMRSHKRSRC